MEELTQFVTKSFEDKIREKCFDKKEVHVTDERKETETSVYSGGLDITKCEETATDLSMSNVEVHVDVCSSQPQTPQPEKLGFEPGNQLKNCRDKFQVAEIFILLIYCSLSIVLLKTYAGLNN